MTSLAELDDIVFGRPRNGRLPKAGLEPLEFSVVRSLEAEDIPEIANGRPLVPSVIPTPQTMKHSHHQLARLIAQGRDVIEISLLTGYTPTYIGNLKQGKDFQELVVYYSSQREAMFVDVLERMKLAGVTTLERLQALLDDDQEKWTKRELMEMAELMCIKPIQARATASSGSGAGAPGGVTVNVKFVSAKDSGPGGPVIDITPEESDDA